MVLEFEPAGEHASKLRFTHLGWGDGADWDKAYEYFDNAWGAIVLPRLIHRFEKGPIDWNAKLELEPVASTMKQALAVKEGSETAPANSN